jgi:hypothetical protein
MFLALAVIASAALVAIYAYKVTPKKSSTIARLHEMKQAIAAFARHNNRPPDSAQSLMASSSPWLDGWGQPIHYSIDSNLCVTLRSYGADRKEGGADDNADIIGSFQLRLPPELDIDWITNTWTFHASVVVKEKQP